MRHAIIGDGGGYDEAHDHNLEIGAIKTNQNLPRGRAKNLPDADLLPFILAVEDHEAEHAYHRDENGYRAEQRDQRTDGALLLVELLEDFIEEKDVERIVRIQFFQHRLYMLHCSTHICARFHADINVAGVVSPIFLSPHIECHRLDRITERCKLHVWHKADDLGAVDHRA